MRGEYTFDDLDLLTRAAVTQALLREEVPEQAGPPDPGMINSGQPPVAAEEQEQPS